MTIQRKKEYGRRLRRLGVVVAASLTLAGAYAQSPGDVVSPLPDGFLERAAMMDASGNYRGVIDQISRLQALGEKYPELLLAKAYYELGDERCIPLLENFIASRPSDIDSTEARLLLGDFYFFRHDFAGALRNYDGVVNGQLAPADYATYSYREGFSLLRTGHPERAVPLFSRLLPNTTYGPAAQFYLAYIDYCDRNYDKAYEEFEKAVARVNDAFGSDPQSGSSRQTMRRKGEYVPTGLEAGYYMLQIDFMRGEYEKVVSNGRSLLMKQPVKELIPETRRVIGESYFKLGMYDDALSYLEEYVADPDVTPAPSAIYALGVIEYDDGDYKKAAERFSAIDGLNNDLAQSAALYLGQCAIHEGEADLAAISFKKAYTMNYDPKVAETALYNYIAATTRGGKVPFTSSVSLLEEFIDTYPRSKYAPEIEQYLAAAYYNDKDYDKALASISRIQSPDAKVLAAKQKILYELGVREMSNDRPAEAEKYLLQAQELKRFDSKIASQTELWLGDAQYALKKYGAAQTAYSSYVKSEKNTDNSALAVYNLAYSYYMQDKFKEALTSFDDALKARPALPKALATDALVRKADCLYYLGNLNSAADAFAKAIGEGSADADYAAMRKAVIAGVNGNNKEKARLLEEMMQTYPHSKWISTALLEQALAYAEDDDTEKALSTFSRLADKYPNAPETRNALLQMALLYSKSGRTDEAIEAYKHIISKWPSSQEASLAGDDLRAIYARRGDLAVLATFLKSIPGAPQLDDNEVEELTFEAAASAFAAGENADKLLSYVAAYPDGKYLAQALRDIAEYQAEDLHQPETALKTIAELLEKRPDSPQAPGALLLRAQILEENYPERRDEIINTYREVESKGGSAYAQTAWAGIMRNTADVNERIEYARRVREAGGLSSDDIDEARFYEASGMLDSGKDAKDAVAVLRELTKSPQSLAGSKAAAKLGEYYVGNKQYQAAVDLLNTFTDSGTPHYYWLARGYISLADAYKGLGKKYLAVEYIKSLRDNYPGKDADIQEMINKRLKQWK